jgi:hypothetical protein
MRGMVGAFFFTLFDCKGFSFLGRSLGGAMLGCFQASKFLGFHCHPNWPLKGIIITFIQPCKFLKK